MATNPCYMLHVASPSREGVGHRLLPLAHKGLQRLVDGRIQVRRLVVGQHLADQRVGALGGVLGAFGLPLLEGVVVRDRRAVEGGLEVGLCVGAAEEMAARPDFAQRVHGLAVLRQVVALRQGLHHAELVGVHNEFLVG